MECQRITIGAVAGHHFNGQADMTLARHATCGSRSGFFLTRTWLADRAAYNYDPTMGWAHDRWFEWQDEITPTPGGGDAAK